MITKKHLFYLQQLGVEICLPRKSLAIPTSGTAEINYQSPPLVNEIQNQAMLELPANQPTDMSDTDGLWQTLEQEVRYCTLCGLCQTRTQTVFGSGYQHAEWMLIGEAPGSEEDKQGLPFVGPAGKLLTKMLQAIGLHREEVYIANVLKCRPPENRNPHAEEVNHCLQYLHRQIKLVEPEIVLLLGGVAASALFGKQSSVAKLRLQVHQLLNVSAPVVVTYHPAYLLRSPQQKKAAWEDLKFACQTVGRTLP